MIRAIIVFALLMFDLTMKGQTSELEKRIFQMDDFADSLYMNGKYNDALNISAKILNICDSANIKDGNNYAILLSHHANINAALGRYNQAIEYGLRSYEIRKKLLETNEEDTTYLVNYALSLYNIANYYSLNYEYDEAFAYAEAAERLRYGLITNNYDNTLTGIEIYASTLDILASCHLFYHKYDKALETGNEAMKIRKHFFGKESAQYAISLCTIARIYSLKGNYEEAIRCEQEALNIRENTLGVKHKDYSASLAHIASYNYYMGDYKNAIRYVIRGLNIDKEIYGELHPNYASKLDNLALYLYNMHDNNTAIEYEERALIIREKNDSTSYGYVVSLSNMAMFQYRKGNTKEAINYSNRALKIAERIFGNNSQQYAVSLSNLCNYYYTNGDIEKAISLGEKALKIRKEALEPSHHDIAISYRNLANYYRGNKQYDKALEYDSISLHIFDKNSIEYAEALYKLSADYFIKGEKKNSVIHFEKSIDAYWTYIQDMFGLLSSAEREKIWGSFGHVFQEDLLYLSYQLGINIADKIYDVTAMLSKGFLLKIDTSEKTFVQSCNNGVAISLFERYQQNMSALSSINTGTSSLRDSVLNQAYIIRDSLISILPQFGELQFKLYTWRDVQKSLKCKDVAIEFVKCTECGNDLYFALILRKEGKPQLVYVCSLNESSEIDKQKLSRRLWESIAPYISGASNIYFSPIGLLNNIPLEYFYTDNSCNIYRLSSTKELVKERKNIKCENGVLYGGLDYGHNSGDSLDGKRNHSDSSELHVSTYNKKINRSGFERLLSTKEEVLSIEKLMKNYKITTHVYTDSEGTEESFYKMPQIKPEIIHLSTHGMYIPLRDAQTMKEKNNLNFIKEESEYIEEDLSLARSFVVMSGGNKLISRESFSEGVEDGILTAQEISQMNLQCVDLVVLSACQTGLGDINNEGVYGLQRGFKKSGVNTILMSLDKVDDEATRILMVEFYRNLMNGKTKHQSLQDAQQYLRKVENGKYDDPKYWASFIMLDGLD